MKSKYLLILFLIAEISAMVKFQFVKCIRNIPLTKCNIGYICVCVNDYFKPDLKCTKDFCAMNLNITAIKCENGVITNAENFTANCCSSYFCKK